MRRIPESGECSCGWHYAYNKEEQETFLTPGTLLDNGQYMVGRALGRGGFGLTYLGRKQDELGLKVAIKEYFPRKLAGRKMSEASAIFLLHGQAADEAMLLERYEKGKADFIEEARRLVTFNELPSIVGVLGYFEENNTAYIVMEYVDGIDLQHYMQQIGRTLTVQEVKQFIIPIAEDLYQVHQSGIIHRDISPDNIMVSRNGSVKLIDFGASVFQGENARVLRKNGFAPPEQYGNTGGELGAWTDVYALCATAYMLLSGRMLQDARDRQHTDTFRTLNEMSIMVPRKLDRLLEWGLKLDWKKRCPSMKELVQQLKKVRSHRRHRGWTGAGAGLLIGLSACAAGYLYLYQWNDTRPVLAEGAVVSRMEAADSAETEEGNFASAATNYAVFEDRVYIRYVFEDGTIMLMRSPVGTDDFSEVEYVTDGNLGQFCVYEDYLYFSGTEDSCMYRVNLSVLMGLADEERSVEKLRKAGILQKISASLDNRKYGFFLEDGYLYTMVEERGSFEFRRISVDGAEQYTTALGLKLTNLVLRNDFLIFTTRDGEETVLQRMRLDGCYYQELARFSGDIPAMMVSGDTLYYMLNSEEEGCLGCIGINGAEGRILVRKNNADLQYCDMSDIVDNNNIYYTCSIEGSEMLNNLYCYSLEDGNNRQISSECGRYIATSDEIPYIIFASMDGSEIRQMNKDGSNPRIMREADGSTGILETVDITSLTIIRDHVYYLDGENVGYKKIESEEL